MEVTARTVQSADPARHVVTVVVVSHDGSRWLPETLTALRGQSRPVQRVLGVDTGSRDDSPEILAEHIAGEAVLHLPRDTGFGEAVRAAAEHPRARRAVPGASDRGDAIEWLWLVHDDCVPDPHALDHLLRAADEYPHAAVLGPKLRDLFDRRLLIEVGVTIDGAGRRETGLEAREFDQGQHDGTRQVLAVSSAGMLVRRDVWEELEGYDPALPLFRDDIDFCWRAGSAGYRVMVAPDAVAYHAAAASRRRRSIAVGRAHPHRIDRRNAVFVLLANLPFAAMVLALLRNTVASGFRMLFQLLAKQPAHALDELLAITSILFHPLRLARARAHRRRTRRRTYSAIQPFLARGVVLRQLAERGANLLSASTETSGRHQAGAPATDEEEILSDQQGLLRRAAKHPGVLLVVALTVVTVVAERTLLGGTRLGGGALLPVGGSAAELWGTYATGWHSVGVGSDAPAPPYIAVLAVVSTVLLGQTWLAVTILLLGCVPLSGLTAYLLARQVLSYQPAQLWMAASYALLPVATGAIAQGRLGTAVVHTLMPVLGLLATRMLMQPARASRRTAWLLALVLAVATAFVPLVWAFSLLTAVLVALAFGNVRGSLYRSLAIVLVAPLVLLLPWSLGLFRHPELWLLEAGLHRPEISDASLSAPALLLLSPGGPGTPPLWVTLGFVAAALCALLLRGRRMLVASGWAMALLGILIAILMSRTVLTAPGGGPVAAAWPGVAVAFAATAMLLSAGIAARSFPDLFRAGGTRRVFASVVALLALTTPVASAATWMSTGVEGPLSTTGQYAFPSLAASLSADGTEPRTLVLQPGPDRASVAYSVLRGEHPQLGDEQLWPDPRVSGELDETVAELAAGRGGESAAALAEFGIRYVVLAGETSAEVDDTFVTRLDGTPHLRRLNLTPSFALWELDLDTGRMRILSPQDQDADAPLSLETAPGVADDPTESVDVLEVDPDDINRVDVPAGEADRLLVLAEPAAAGWSATQDGVELPPVEVDTGMQGFELQDSAGTVEIDRSATPRPLWLLLQALLVATVIVFALPGARGADGQDQDRDTETERPRRPTPRRPDRAIARVRARRRGRRAQQRGRAGRRHTR
ncbi:glycosyltransferase [Lipingzhangella sp. LS1_29]|uniref:Glycosyltransferase n=1 Tax=Lipingzhangella rawalii TaxID=2055835 RepID=A0ABU2H6B1_9ACTN|nr:glycosyltransferase [Lipingzhangella rawalii]MDS1270384.1 glycosyltransferase [Lipingzhangella rawalii]